MPSILPGSEDKRFNTETTRGSRDLDLTSEPYEASIADDVDLFGAGIYEGDTALHDFEGSVLSGDFGFQTVDKCFSET